VVARWAKHLAVGPRFRCRLTFERSRESGTVRGAPVSAERPHFASPHANRLRVGRQVAGVRFAAAVAERPTLDLTSPWLQSGSAPQAVRAAAKKACRAPVPAVYQGLEPRTRCGASRIPSTSFA
jgi:hypothetical protein